MPFSIKRTFAACAMDSFISAAILLSPLLCASLSAVLLYCPAGRCSSAVIPWESRYAVDGMPHHGSLRYVMLACRITGVSGMLCWHAALREYPACYVGMLHRRNPGMSYILNQLLNGLHRQIDGCNFIGTPLQFIFYQILVGNFMLVFNLMFQAGPEILSNGAKLDFRK